MKRIIGLLSTTVVGLSLMACGQGGSEESMAGMRRAEEARETQSKTEDAKAKAEEAQAQ